jgi:hypothetical protein
MHNEIKIINRVANSKLVTIDLEDFYPKGERISFDIKQWLYEGIVLKEKDFRESVKNHDWSQYKDSFVALFCSSDAIIPSWAYLLITVNLEPFTKRVVVGELEKIETILFTEIINGFDIDFFKNKSILIKGCSEKPVPQTAYIQLVEKLMPVVTSIMYGEACSNVPLYNAKK